MTFYYGFLKRSVGCLQSKTVFVGLAFTETKWLGHPDSLYHKKSGCVFQHTGQYSQQAQEHISIKHQSFKSAYTWTGFSSAWPEKQLIKMYFRIILLKPEQMQIHSLALLLTNAIENREYARRRGNGPFTQYVQKGQCADDQILWDSQMGKYVLRS